MLIAEFLATFGAAGGLRKAIGAELYPDEQRRMDAWLNLVYSARGERACAEVRASGRATPLAQIIAIAVEPTD